MEIKDFNQTMDGVEKIFRSHSDKRESKRYHHDQPYIFKFAILVGVFLLGLFYYFLPSSRVQSVQISGNQYVSKTYIQELAGVYPNDIYFLKFPHYIQYKLEDNPLIDHAKVSLKQGNVVAIGIEEKKMIGYRFDQEEEPILLFADGSYAPLQSSFLEAIAMVPKITGFQEEEQTRLLTKAFSNVDRAIISQISEISQYGVGYDDEIIRILMRNGIYVIGNYFNLETMNDFNRLYNALENKNQCIYLTEKDQAADAYASACPWNQEKVDKEYWMSDSGEIMTNEYGDPAAKNYYTLLDGEFALDQNGNKIPIPINEKGNEVKDIDFQEHYDNGYYATGVLVLPE